MNLAFLQMNMLRDIIVVKHLVLDIHAKMVIGIVVSKIKDEVTHNVFVLVNHDVVFH